MLVCIFLTLRVFLIYGPGVYTEKKYWERRFRIRTPFYFSNKYQPNFGNQNYFILKENNNTIFKKTALTYLNLRA